MSADGELGPQHGLQLPLLLHLQNYIKVRLQPERPAWQFAAFQISFSLQLLSFCLFLPEYYSVHVLYL